MTNDAMTIEMLEMLGRLLAIRAGSSTKSRRWLAALRAAARAMRKG